MHPLGRSWPEVCAKLARSWYAVDPKMVRSWPKVRTKLCSEVDSKWKHMFCAYCIYSIMIVTEKFASRLSTVSSSAAGWLGVIIPVIPRQI